MKRFEKIKKARFRKKLNETNDCVVIAIAIAARMTYEKAHGICQYQGRKNGKGIVTTYALEHLEKMGFNVEKVKNLRQKNGSRYTPKTIGNKLKRGYYIVRKKTHAFAVVNGTVEDWTSGRQHHIKDAFKITRKRAE